MGETARAAALLAYVRAYPAPGKIETQSETPRNVRNSTTVSEHTFGNALDIFGPRPVLEKLAAELDRDRAKWQIGTLCYDPGIGRKYDVCTTKHDDHIHVDFRPHCGGRVTVAGTAEQLVTACNNYQLGKAGPVTTDPHENELIGGLLEPITTALRSGLIIVVGVAIGIAGIVLLVKDTAVGEAVTGTVKTVVTKGLAPPKGAT